ncbi:MAG: SDR family NAD(P)-dependent oxidoreductase [Rectinemataceae bacterium]
MSVPTQHRAVSTDSNGALSHFAGRSALVVGGSGGIGAHVAMQLAARGAIPVIQGRDPGRVAAAVARIEAAGGQAKPLALELNSARDLIDALDEPLRFDILVVAFGPFVQKSLADTSPEEWERLAVLDLALPGAMASALLPGMLARGWGRMLFFGGTRTDGIRAYRSNAAYAAAKTGVSVLVKSLAAEGGDRNVAAIAVCPGLVGTEYVSPGVRDALSASAPGGRLLAPGEIARISLDLLDADPCSASGALVSLDAGFSPS